jgi:hypothetical protein
LGFLLVLFASSGASAEEWNKVTPVCPICGAVNTFQSVAGSPADVYGRPERLEYVFWPATDRRILYSCRRCRYTVFMSDWNAVPSGRQTAIHDALRTVTVNTSVSDYTTIPMSTRFEIAEKVYLAWGRDDTFMCAFYRARAWNLDAEQLTGDAAKARRKALEIATKELSLEFRPGPQKELLFIVASLKHMTGDDQAALADLKRAAGIAYENEKDELAPGVRRDRYIPKLIDELSTVIAGPSSAVASTSSELTAAPAK